MFGGLGKSAGWASALVAGGVILGLSAPASAADLGGDCCADLEERIAELEATTARKGNRKVKLTVYGKVNQAVMWWDDGEEQNAYVVTNDSSRTRFGFKGGAKITEDLSANFRLEVGIRTANSKRDNQVDPVGAFGFDVRHAWWNIKSKTWGTIQVGHTPTASQDVTEINLAGTGSVGKYSDPEDSGGGFFLRTGNAPIPFDADGDPIGTQWRRLITRSGDSPGEGDRRQAIYYISPAIAGFYAKAAWGGDDFWDAGIWYENEFGSLKVEAGIAYGQQNDRDDDFTLNGCPVRDEAPSFDAKCQQLGGSISILDKNSGLYGNFAAGQMWDDSAAYLDVANPALVDDTYWFYALEAGIQQKWNHLGKTTLFGQYYHYEGGNIDQTVDELDPINPLGEDAFIAGSEVQYWGIGAMQKIDAAAMKLYVLYRHFTFDATLMAKEDAAAAVASRPLNDFDVIMTGAEIKF